MYPLHAPLPKSISQIWNTIPHLLYAQGIGRPLNAQNCMSALVFQLRRESVDKYMGHINYIFW